MVFLPQKSYRKGSYKINRLYLNKILSCEGPNTCSPLTGKGSPEACQRDYKLLVDLSPNFTLFLAASLMLFSPHAG